MTEDSEKLNPKKSEKESQGAPVHQKELVSNPDNKQRNLDLDYKKREWQNRIDFWLQLSVKCLVFSVIALLSLFFIRAVYSYLNLIIYSIGNGGDLTKDQAFLKLENLLITVFSFSAGGLISQVVLKIFHKAE